MRRRDLERVLDTDPGTGVMRHVDAGYARAIEVADGAGCPRARSARATGLDPEKPSIPVTCSSVPDVATVHLIQPLRGLADDRPEVEVSGTDVRGILEDLTTRFPPIATWILDDTGRSGPTFRSFVHGEQLLGSSRGERIRRRPHPAGDLRRCR